MADEDGGCVLQDWTNLRLDPVVTASPPTEISLLTKRRFAPLFITNFLDAFNDNLFKTALLVLVSYVIYRGDTGRAAMLATAATGLFILPFFLFSALAGEIADAFERARLVQLVKVSEVAIMGLGLVGFASQSTPTLLTALFLMGVHSAFYGPLKYAILPLHLKQDELLGGTGVMEAGGFIAILGGQLLAGVLAAWVAGVIACVLAGLGLVASLAILPARPANTGGRIDLNIAVVSWRLVRMARSIRPVWLSILAIAWFYAVGAVLLGELIPLVKGMLHGRQDVAVLFLAIFSVGVAVGSLVVNRLLKGEISARYVPISALLLAGLLIDLALALGGFRAHGQDVGIVGFLAMPGALRIVFDLAAISICGGVFVIPLYTILQTRSPDAERSRILAANNIVNAAVTVSAIGVAGALLQLGVGIAGLIALMGVATFCVAGYACVLLPETVVKTLVRAVLRLLYRIEVHGAEHMPEPGTGVVVVVNHLSYLDGLILAVFLPGKPRFALHTAIFKVWWMKPVLPFFDALPVDHTSPLSVKAMVKAVREGHTLVVFPEGRISVTGALMKVFAGPAVVADKADAPIVAVRIDGTQYTRFSLMKSKLRRRALPKIRLSILGPQRLALPDGLGRGRKRRAMASERLLRCHERHDVFHCRHGPHPVPGRAGRPRRPWPQSARCGGRQATAAVLRQAGDRRGAAGEPAPGRYDARRGGGLDAAERERCGGRLLRPSVGSAHSGHAQLHRRTRQPGSCLRRGQDRHGGDRARLRRTGQAAAHGGAARGLGPPHRVARRRRGDDHRRSQTASPADGAHDEPVPPPPDRVRHAPRWCCSPPAPRGRRKAWC